MSIFEQDALKPAPASQPGGPTPPEVFEGPSGLIGSSMADLCGQDAGAPPPKNTGTPCGDWVHNLPAQRCECHGSEVCPASHSPEFGC